MYKVAVGPVMQSKIPYGDPYWREFNASFQNLELDGLDLASHIYDGRPITTWHKDHWRHSRNYICGQHLGLDFDTGDKLSSLPHLMRDPLIGKYGGILYTTPSHTPDSPRARALFLLDTPIMQATNYAMASAALLWVFGTADRQCKDAARFFYGGKPGICEMEWLDHELPLTVIKDMIARYEATGRQERKRVHAKYKAGTAEEAEVIEALRFIDPWGIGYDEWLSVLLAIHSEWPGTNGMLIAESWAAGKDGEVERKWRGFDPGGNYAGRVGIGTLFAMAKDRGWTRERQRPV